jgi:hypothetical protein
METIVFITIIATVLVVKFYYIPTKTKEAYDKGYKAGKQKR